MEHSDSSMDLLLDHFVSEVVMAEQRSEQEQEEEELYLDVIHRILPQVWAVEIPPHPTELQPYLYIGGYSNADDVRTLRQLGITHVLNCAAYRKTDESPYDPLMTGVVGYKQFWATDAEHYDMLRHFTAARDFIDSARAGGGKVLVHCAMGINRSGAICAAYLMYSLQLGLLEVLQLMKERRGTILCNQGFQRQLIRFARTHGLLTGAEALAETPMEVCDPQETASVRCERLNGAFNRLKEKHRSLCSNHEALITHRTSLSSDVTRDAPSSDAASQKPRSLDDHNSNLIHLPRQGIKKGEPFDTEAFHLALREIETAAVTGYQ